MYKVIGADGNEYGPVSAEVLREWILQGRANGQTQVLAPGAAQWQTLSAVPEFAGPLARAATPVIAPVYSPAAQRTNSLATVSLALGIFSVTIGLCCCYGLPFNIAGLVCAFVALAQINSNPQAEQGKGVAIAGLVLSILSLLVAGVLFLFGAALSMPDLMHKLERL